MFSNWGTSGTSKATTSGTKAQATTVDVGDGKVVVCVCVLIKVYMQQRRWRLSGCGSAAAAARAAAARRRLRLLQQLLLHLGEGLLLLGELLPQLLLHRCLLLPLSPARSR